MTGEQAEKSNWGIVVAMTACQALVLFDLTAFGVALPSMQRDLSLSATSASWSVNAYVIAYAAIVAIGGRLADRSNRHRVFLLGMFLFLVGSVACGLAPANSELAAAWLIGFRALQGIGGALMIPAALAVVVTAVPASQRGRAMSLYIGGGQVFFILGPILGGFLTEQLSWRWIFFLAVPLCVAAAAMTLLWAPEARQKGQTRKGPLLRWSALPLILGMALVILSLERGGAWGWLSWPTLGALAVGIGCLVWLVFIETRAADPLVELDLLKKPGFRLSVTTLFLLQMVTIGVVIFAPFYFQRHFGLDPADSGTLMLAFIGGWVIIVPLAGFIHDRFGAARPIAAGALIAVAGLAFWTWRLPDPNLALLIPAMIVSGIGVGLSILPANTTAVSAAPETNRAAGVGLVQTIRQFGGAVAVAALSGQFLTQQTLGSTGGGALTGEAKDAAVSLAQNGFVLLVAAAAINLIVAVIGLRYEKRRPAG